MPAVEQRELAVEDAAETPAPSAAAGEDAIEPDPVLASARASMRDGQVSAQARAQLLASSDPDHRRAGRLLQSIAGEQPAPILPSVPVRPAAPEPVAPEPVAPEPVVPEPVGPATEPAPKPTIDAAPEPTRDPGQDDETIDPPPKLAKLPPEGVVAQWFAGASIVEPEPEPEPVTTLEPMLEPELLLLRERPPLPPISDAGDRPGLVILTRASLHDGPAPETVVLELAGAGPAEVSVQPLDRHHLRLWLVDAGAVPSFLSDRPSHAGIEVLDIVRRERVVELELVLAPGWALAEVTRLDNGAAVHFSRLEELPP